MTLTLTIPGPPVGKARPRFSRRLGRAYKAKTNITQEGYIKAVFAEAYPAHVPLEGPLEFDLAVFFPIPVSASKKRQTDMRTGRELPTKKPDGSNILRLCEDALNGLAYRDDSQLVSEFVSKRYSDRPRLEIKVRPAGEMP